jgi:hypothetical protein
MECWKDKNCLVAACNKEGSINMFIIYGRNICAALVQNIKEFHTETTKGCGLESKQFNG